MFDDEEGPGPIGLIFLDVSTLYYHHRMYCVIGIFPHRKGQNTLRKPINMLFWIQKHVVQIQYYYF